MSLLRCATWALLLAIGAAAPARAQFTVSTGADTSDANPGDLLCADTAGACSLRAAIEESNAHLGSETILVPPGLYVVATQLAITDTFGTLSIDGGSAATTTISGSGTDRVFAMAAGVHTTIKNLTIRNGHALGGNHGGGILNAGAL